MEFFSWYFSLTSTATSLCFLPFSYFYDKESNPSQPHHLHSPTCVPALICPMLSCFHLIFSVSLFPLPLFFSSLSQLPLALFHPYALLVSNLRFHLHTHKSHSYSTCALSHALKWVGTQAETCKSAESTHVNTIYIVHTCVCSMNMYGVP